MNCWRELHERTEGCDAKWMQKVSAGQAEDGGSSKDGKQEQYATATAKHHSVAQGLLVSKDIQRCLAEGEYYYEELSLGGSGGEGIAD